jgi:hypothetical protein
LKGQVAQADDLLQFQDDTGAVLSRFNEEGFLGVGVDPVYPLSVYKMWASQTFAGDPEPVYGLDVLVDFSSSLGANVFGATLNRIEGRYTEVLNAGSAVDHVQALNVIARVDIDDFAAGDNVGMLCGYYYTVEEPTNTYPIIDLTGFLAVAERWGTGGTPSLYGGWAYTGVISGATNILTSQDLVGGAGYTDAGLTIPLWIAVTAYPPYMDAATDVMDEWVGLWVRNYSRDFGPAGLGSFVDYYGIRLDDPTDDHAVSGVLYSIYSEAGEARLHAGSATTIPLVAKGAVAQSANLQDWRSSADTVLASVSAGGTVTGQILSVKGNINLTSSAGGVLGIGGDLRYDEPARTLKLGNNPAGGADQLITWDNAAPFGWTYQADGGATAETRFVFKEKAAQTAYPTEWQDSAAGFLLGVLPGGAIEMVEQTDPAAPAANRLRLYARDNGSGLTQLLVEFPSGNTVVIAEDF